MNPPKQVNYSFSLNVICESSQCFIDRTKNGIPGSETGMKIFFSYSFQYPFLTLYTLFSFHPPGYATGLDESGQKKPDAVWTASLAFFVQILFAKKVAEIGYFDFHGLLTFCMHFLLSRPADPKQFTLAAGNSYQIKILLNRNKAFSSCSANTKIRIKLEGSCLDFLGNG